jgi:hypothetical protein
VLAKTPQAPAPKLAPARQLVAAHLVYDQHDGQLELLV